MGILYQIDSAQTWGTIFFVLLALMAFNEFGRQTKWGGILLFVVAPIILTIFVWPSTAAMGNKYGTGTWFNWVKTYSCLAGCVGFMLIRYIPKLQTNKWALRFPPFILAANILEACIRDFQVYSFGLFDGGIVDNLWTISGPWNIMNGISGIFNILIITGWVGIYISKDKSKDMIFPDMIWTYVIAYDLWNFAYTYNCISNHSMWCGMVLLLACTIPTFFIKRGAWLQHRASTLALWIMFIMTVPQFADELAYVPTTQNPTAFFIVSLVSLIANVSVFVYQRKKIKAHKLNQLRGDEVNTDTKAYKQVTLENK